MSNTAGRHSKDKWATGSLQEENTDSVSSEVDRQCMILAGLLQPAGPICSPLALGSGADGIKAFPQWDCAE